MPARLAVCVAELRCSKDLLAGVRFGSVEGWLETLTEEYYSQARPIMLSIDQQTPFDMIGGIGIYDVAESLRILPRMTHTRGWDGFLIEEFPELVYRTELIMHSYGIYNHQGIATHHRFPRDQWMIRKSAVIFHKDQFQDLIPK